MDSSALPTHLIALGESKGLADAQEALGITDSVLLGALDWAWGSLANILLVLEAPGR